MVSELSAAIELECGKLKEQESVAAYVRQMCINCLSSNNQPTRPELFAPAVGLRREPFVVAHFKTQIRVAMLRASLTAASRHRFNASDITALTARPATCRTRSVFSFPRALHSSSTTASAASQSTDPAAAAAAAEAHTASNSTQHSNAGARASIPRPRAVGEKHQILDEMLRVDHAVLFNLSKLRRHVFSLFFFCHQIHLASI
jgi:hypothetical protein